MRRILPCLTIFAITAFFLPQEETTAAQDSWGTIKGKIVWGGDTIPERKTISVTVNAQQCLFANLTADHDKQTILDENLLIDSKTKGIKNVFLYIYLMDGQKIAIHPSLQKVDGDLTIDQPACMFFPRALILRQGQKLIVKNSAEIPHNIRWIGDGVANQGGNVNIAPGGSTEIKGLMAQRLPLPIECNIHGWMKGRLAVVDHPYFALTNEKGEFEIKNLPVGVHNIMIYHEEVGYRLGAKGKNGEPITVKAGINDLGILPMGK